MIRERQQIEKDIMSLLGLDEWSADDKAKYEELIEEYPMENPTDALAIASFDEAADLLTGELS